jgi:hypothetical protein
MAPAQGGQPRHHPAQHDPASDASANHTAADISVTCPMGSTGTPTIVNAASYTPASGAWVLFTTSYLYHPTTPVIGRLIGTVTVTQTTNMVIE